MIFKQGENKKLLNFPLIIQIYHTDTFSNQNCHMSLYICQYSYDAMIKITYIVYTPFIIYLYNIHASYFVFSDFTPKTTIMLGVTFFTYLSDRGNNKTVISQDTNELLLPSVDSPLLHNCCQTINDD